MTIVHGRTFRSGNSEAVRLPREVAFGVGTPVTMVRSGDVLTIRRARPSIKEMLERLASLPKPQTVETRDEDIFPERPGL